MKLNGRIDQSHGITKHKRQCELTKKIETSN